MKQLRSLFASLFLIITMFFSTSTAQAAEIIIPTYGTFGGGTIAGDIFEWSSTSGEYQSWGGFAATNEGGGEAYLPFIFSVDGQLTVNAAVPGGGNATLRFVFENAPHPNNIPNFEVSIPISGSTITPYSVALPAQGDQTFSNFVFYITTVDTPVQIQDIQVAYDDPVVDPNAPTPGAAGETTITTWGSFDGTSNEDGVFNFPSDAQSWAGFANDDASVYPFSFNSEGQITFTASIPSGGSANVYFRFEKNVWPDVNPLYNTAQATVSGSTPTEYTIDIPSQGDNTFSSFLFFIVDRDTPVLLGDVIVSDDEGEAVTISNGVNFKFEDVVDSEGAPAHWINVPTTEVLNTSPQTFTVTVPAHTNGTDVFKSMLMYVVGLDQAIVVQDVTLDVGGVTYGGTGSDSLVFRTVYGGSQVDELTYTYGVPTGSETWAGFKLSNPELLDIYDNSNNGLVFPTEGTISFTAYLSDTPVTPVPNYDGETAFSNGVIDMSPDSGTGLDPDPPYKWSASVTRNEINSDGTEGAFQGYTAQWDPASNLPATWDNSNGIDILTMSPNTSAFNGWQMLDEDGITWIGNKYIHHYYMIEGAAGNDLGTSDLLGKTVTFSGIVHDYTLDSDYDVIAFVGYVDESNSPYREEKIITSSDIDNSFSVTFDIPSGQNVPQIGFILKGRNISPEDDKGEVKFSNLSATYDSITSITEGNFSNGSASYWSLFSGVSFETDEGKGYGSVPGQVKFTNTTATRSSVYTESAQGSWSLIEDFGMEAGNSYRATYFMNRVEGDDLGLVQFYFWGNDIGYVYSPENAETFTHTNSSPTNGTWNEYSQTITVPEGATHAILYIISGANSVIEFDQLDLTLIVAPSLTISSNDTDVTLQWSDSPDFQIHTSSDLNSWTPTGDLESPYSEPVGSNKFYKLSNE